MTRIIKKKLQEYIFTTQALYCNGNHWKIECEDHCACDILKGKQAKTGQNICGLHMSVVLKGILLLQCIHVLERKTKCEYDFYGQIDFNILYCLSVRRW